jgi:catechol 2,3-dioxygenase-like lactoylglutathione lyase family enzyme
MRRDGLRGINHIGVPVRSLDDTVAWYREMFEIEPTFYLRGVTGPEVAETVQVAGGPTKVDSVLNAASAAFRPCMDGHDETYV